MRVLVVDDDIIIRHYFVRTLRRHVEVEEASGVTEALAKLRTIPFDIVLTDEHMPDGSGRALLAQASRLQLHCRRILMSADELVLNESSIHERSFAKVGGLPHVVAWIRAAASQSQR
ncbi:MAG: hypothetical protein BGO98_15220 [Myxococcales bacterium 68-20]|nr:response regulator [Myxococcales bacterium]OJY31414.1 MAG: hypothetical protein BGO98_15220 [Myxococcales bacterium 68-20]